jgi:hypothetical protein
MALRVSRGIALPFLDRGIRRRWVVSSMPWPHFTSGEDPVPIVQEAGWAPGPVWTGGKSCPTGIRSPDRPARSQSLYRLSYNAVCVFLISTCKICWMAFMKIWCQHIAIDSYSVIPFDYRLPVLPTFEFRAVLVILMWGFEISYSKQAYINLQRLLR